LDDWLIIVIIFAVVIGALIFFSLCRWR